MEDSPSSNLIVTPIGFIRTDMKLKFDAPHQPENDSETTGLIELNPNSGFETALSDLQEFDRIWLVWWFHKNKNWRPMVRPPRGDEKRRGVLATRSPHRPNPIGISAVPLIGIDGLKVIIGNHDLIDGTPILDIKPYIRSVDSFPEASLGWLSNIEEECSFDGRYNVRISEVAKAQIEWLERRGVSFIERATRVLSRDPRPHRTRRISACEEGQFRMGCGAWRVYFSIEQFDVVVERITPGYPERLLYSDAHDEVPNRESQIEFNSVWPAE